MNKDIQRIRELAKETLEYANCEEMDRRRTLWSEHNALNFTRPPIYIRAIPFDEFFDPKELRCESPYFAGIEKNLLLNRYRMLLKDDYIIEPFLVVPASLEISPNGVYGVRDALSHKPCAGGAAKYNPAIMEEEDLEKLKVADYKVDEGRTKAGYEQLANVLGDILPVVVNRQGPLTQAWNCDISTSLAKMRGLEQIMWDCYDRPEWLHKLLGFMQEKILLHFDQTEANQGFKLINHQNQAMPYMKGLTPPSADDTPVKANELWGFVASQETTTFGPDLFKEFMFDYQKPIMERFAYISYGCCEDLTYKIDIIKELKNLRRIAVSPFCNVKKCAEQIGSDYITSWRPNPSSHVSFGVNETFVKEELRKNFDIFEQNKCPFDITLKDVETVSRDPDAIIKWTQIVRDEIDRKYGN